MEFIGQRYILYKSTGNSVSNLFLNVIVVVGCKPQQCDSLTKAIFLTLIAFNVIDYLIFVITDLLLHTNQTPLLEALWSNISSCLSPFALFLLLLLCPCLFVSLPHDTNHQTCPYHRPNNTFHFAIPPTTLYIFVWHIEPDHPEGKASLGTGGQGGAGHGRVPVPLPRQHGLHLVLLLVSWFHLLRRTRGLPRRFGFGPATGTGEA